MAQIHLCAVPANFKGPCDAVSKSITDIVARIYNRAVPANVKGCHDAVGKVIADSRARIHRHAVPANFKGDHDAVGNDLSLTTSVSGIRQKSYLKENCPVLITIIINLCCRNIS